MTQIDNLTDQANQLTKVVLPDGTTLTLELLYQGATERWIVNITHPLITVQGMALSNYPNLLRSWRNVINFGLACITQSGIDPVSVEDFINGNTALYVLSATEVTEVESDVFGGALQ